jgi:6-phosphogluconolactonase
MELIVAPIVELRAQLTHVFEELVGRVVDSGATSSADPHTFTCGLTGGSTALIFLGALRDAAVDWSRITLFWGDERAVAPDHPDSNYGLAEGVLLSPLGGRAPRAMPMPADRADLDAAAREYDGLLPPALDLLILGTGDDGHVCSLFPAHPALRIDDRRVTAITDSPKPPAQRLTLTMSYVVAAREVWVVAVGARKLTVLQQAVLRQTMTTPLDLVLSQAANVTVFTDQLIRM